MSAVTVYYVTLKKLADEGNAEAALALKIGENVGHANTELGDALSVNDSKWSKETDRCIERARSLITAALSVMAQR
jgi:hypothetical protein